MSGIALVTPLKNEIENIDTLFASVSSQQCEIAVWIIVENGSSDGSAEKLKSISVPENVKRLEILTFSLPEETYALGVKYATVVNQGFLRLREIITRDGMALPSHVGILDADCAPSVGYFGELVKRMAIDSIDLASGVGVFDNGRPDGEAKDWVRGNCRLWSWPCFEDVGYVVGPSADTLSLSKAVSRGYRAKPYHDLVYHCREMGKKSRYDYYGYSAYYRGVTL
jgi:glycosyltransferase involved in cell wall biosynthesis